MADRQMDSQMERETDRMSDNDTGLQRETGRQNISNRETYRQTDRWSVRQIDISSGRQKKQMDR